MSKVEDKHQKINYRNKEYICSLNFVMDLIGDKYKCLILFHLKDGAVRSGILQKTIEGLSTRMFTYSIRALEKDGLVKRIIFPEIPPRVVYELTPEGNSIIPIIIQLDNWGKQFAQEHYLYAPEE